MKIVKPPTAAGFLVRLPAGAAVGLDGGVPSTLTALGARFELEPLFDVATGPVQAGAGMAAAAEPSWTWHIARPISVADAATAWDVAHALQAQAGIAAGAPVLIEPDLEQEWPYENPAARGDASLAAAAACVFNDQRRDLPHVPGGFAWHLDDDRTQLRQARRSVPEPTSPIRIVHLDTGYDEQHEARPAHLRGDLQRNFVSDQPVNDARDPGARGLMKNPGHGTGTLGILAGKRFRFTSGGYTFDDELGGAPGAEIIPVRVGKSVVQLLTSNIAQADQLRRGTLSRRPDTRVHVISMSMGGVASAAWADAVNMAYEAGIVFVAAAGNNFSAGIFGFPTHCHRLSRPLPPRHCGVRRDGQSPAVLFAAVRHDAGQLGTGQQDGHGDVGVHAEHQLGGARVRRHRRHGRLGHLLGDAADCRRGGTVSAAARAGRCSIRLRYPERWMRVEAVRQALFTAADRNSDGGSSEKFGSGVLRAAASLAIDPPLAAALHKTRARQRRVPAAPRPHGSRRRAVSGRERDVGARGHAARAPLEPNTDRPNPIELAVTDPDLPADAVPVDQVRRFLDAVLDHPDASAALKTRATEARSMFMRQTPRRPRQTRAGRGRPEIAKALPPRAEPAPVQPVAPSVPHAPRL